MSLPIEIIPYGDEHAAAFRRLNLAWLEKYNLVESHDLEVIDDPRGSILGRGGYIFVASMNGEVVGTAAIAKTGEADYELAKMAVDERWQGKGISKLLLERCIDTARRHGARAITLFSNHQLTTAIALYEKYGFRHIEVTGSPFATADVKMELVL